MEETRPILYGVADYAWIRKKNAWFVDRTAKIRDLEAIAYAVFLRPRRFGKSLLTSILEAYYDVRYADRLDEFFAGTDIGADPTDERGSYLILRFDFASVTKEPGKVQSDFDCKVALQCDTFARRYRDVITGELADRILSAPDSGKKLSQIYQGLKGTGHRLYVIIDEYDNFTNTILAESGEEAYNELCHGDGFFKQFFTELKSAASGTEAPVTRLFITGVSPVTMDDVTSGFNIGMTISLWPQFADFTGFHHEDIHAMAQYYAPRLLAGHRPRGAYRDEVREGGRSRAHAETAREDQSPGHRPARQVLRCPNFASYALHVTFLRHLAPPRTRVPRRRVCPCGGSLKPVFKYRVSMEENNK